MIWVFLGQVVTILLTLGLTACMHTPPSLIKPPSCHTQCRTQLTTCAVICQNSCAVCSQEVQCKTDETYRQYVAQQRAQGLTVARERNSYRDPLACKKFTCDCMSDYDLCKQRCSGKVKPLLQNPTCILDRSTWAW
jgi:hypothetical protein